MFIRMFKNLNTYYTTIVQYYKHVIVLYYLVIDRMCIFLTFFLLSYYYIKYLLIGDYLLFLIKYTLFIRHKNSRLNHQIRGEYIL